MPPDNETEELETEELDELEEDEEGDDEDTDESEAETDDDEEEGDDEGEEEDKSAKSKKEDTGGAKAEKRNPKRSFQKRINKVTREKHEAIREAEKLRKENADLKKQQHTAQAEKSRPNKGDFEDYEAYEAALEKWARESSVQTDDEETEIEFTPEELELADTMDNIVTQAEQNDFKEVVFNPNLDITLPMVRAASESELAADLLYFLGQNPDEAERISKLPESSIPREIGRLEARLEAGTASAKPKGKTPPTTPNPAKPVKTGKKKVSSELSDDDDIDTWMRKRNAQVANQ